MRCYAAAVALCLWAPLPATAETIYRWVDAAGQVHFSDTQPSGQSQRYDIPAVNAVESEIKDTQDFFEKQARARQEKTKALAEQAARQRQAAAQCKQARARQQFLTERPPNRILITGEDGQPARMTVEQRNTEIARVQARIEAYCDG